MFHIISKWIAITQFIIFRSKIGPSHTIDTNYVKPYRIESDRSKLDEEKTKRARERGKNELPLKWWTCFNGRWISQKSNFPSAVRLLFHSDCEICVPLFLLYYRTWNFFLPSSSRTWNLNQSIWCCCASLIESPLSEKKERRSFASAVWIDWKSLIKHHTVQKEAVTKQ